MADRVKKATEEYDEILRRGEILERVLRKFPDTKEEALNSGDLKALKKYQSAYADECDTSNLTLKPWQAEVLGFVEDPDLRTIHWIVGEIGGEGKTFIQDVIRTRYGTRRVFKSEINTRKADIAYALTQEALTCKDIFLFNLLRSDFEVAYGVLENIKDGYLMSAKYKSTTLRIKTPNVVIVFSNRFPDLTQLSRDRWRIYDINNDRLVDGHNKPLVKKNVRGVPTELKRKSEGVTTAPAKSAKADESKVSRQHHFCRVVEKRPGESDELCEARKEQNEELCREICPIRNVVEGHCCHLVIEDRNEWRSEFKKRKKIFCKKYCPNALCDNVEKWNNKNTN